MAKDASADNRHLRYNFLMIKVAKSCEEKLIRTLKINQVFLTNPFLILHPSNHDLELKLKEQRERERLSHNSLSKMHSLIQLKLSKIMLAKTMCIPRLCKGWCAYSSRTTHACMMVSESIFTLKSSPMNRMLPNERLRFFTSQASRSSVSCFFFSA